MGLATAVNFEHEHKYAVVNRQRSSYCVVPQYNIMPQYVTHIVRRSWMQGPERSNENGNGVHVPTGQGTEYEPGRTATEDNNRCKTIAHLLVGAR